MQPLLLGDHRLGRGLRVSRRTRSFTVVQNSSHAATSLVNESYPGTRFASVGTRSAIAIRTVASDPPLDSESNGTRLDLDAVVPARATRSSRMNPTACRRS